MKPILQRGVAIVSAIFILVVLASLGAFAVSISTSQHLGSVQDIQGSRALQAARAGIEERLYQINFTQGHAGACPADAELAMPAATTLADFTVSVKCTSNGGAPPYTIISTACNQPVTDNAVGSKCPNITSHTNLYIERQMELVF